MSQKTNKLKGMNVVKIAGTSGEKNWSGQLK